MTFAKTGTERIPIVGLIAEDDALVVGSWLTSFSTFDPRFTAALDSQVFIRLAAGTTVAEARPGLEQALAAFPNVDLLDQAGVQERNAAQVDQVLVMMSALLVLSVLIALLGIANTLGLSIIERTRELGLLRAVGMTRRQLRAMVRWEAMITSTLGAVLGLVVAVFFGWVVVRALADDGITELRFPVLQLASYVVLAAILGVVAAVVPARRAAKVKILEAVTTE